MLNSLLKTFLYTLIRILPVRGAVVLMYHSIGDNPEFFTVTPVEFERQMKYLDDNGYEVIKLSQLVNILKRNWSIPSKTVALTFDDGYRDNYLNAFPLLKKYNFPAAIFLTSSLIGKSSVGRKGTHLQMLSWPEIREMAASGLIDFYPHGQSHKKMTFLAEDEAESEISQSKKILESNLAGDLNVFAYPFGDYNQRVIEAAKKCGMEAAFTIETGRTKAGDDLFELKRNSIDSKVTFAMFKGIVKFGRF